MIISGLGFGSCCCSNVKKEALSSRGSPQISRGCDLRVPAGVALGKFSIYSRKYCIRN
jgi:hypothetical protein